MNEPRPTSSQPGMPNPHPQGQPGIRPASQSQPPRVPGAPQAMHAQAAHPQQQRAGVPPLPAAHRPPAPADDGMIALDDDEPIALEEVSSAPITPAAPRLPTAGTSGGTASGVGLSPASKIKFAAGGDKHTYTKFKRQTHITGSGPCRVRSFHGRLSDDGLAYTDDKINEWLDNHPDVEVKFVNCFTGPLEGKVTGEQGLIVVIWY
jgi:hypothetical protein